jgi:predicted flap endonuclease-1-like 5' DNA nuclease
MGTLTTSRAHFRKEVAAERSARNDMVRGLKDGIAVLKSDVAEMLAEFGRKRAEAKTQMRQDLSEFTLRLQSFVDDLGKQVIDMRKAFHRDRAQMIARMDDHLGQFMTSLKNGTARMKTRSIRQRAESKTPPKTDRGTFAGQRNTQTHQKDVVQGKDDLTCIPGIGSRREKLFNQAGIQSFAQLAQCTPEQLRHILGKQGGIVKVEALIAHAQSMAV